MFPVPNSASEKRKYDLRKKKKLVLPVRAAQPGLVSEILELAKSYEEKTVLEREEREKRRKQYKNKPHLVDPAPPAVARMNRLNSLSIKENWSNIHLRRMIRFESMLVYDCLEAKERLEKFKEPIELTEVKSSNGDEWILKTFKRKQSSTGKVSRSDVTPIRIPVANKYAYLVGREENFDAAGFEETLTPTVGDGKRKRVNQYVAGTPQRKRNRNNALTRKTKQVANLSSQDSEKDKSLSKKRPKRKNERAGTQDNSKASPTLDIETESTSPLTKKQRRSTFVPNRTFKYFALICKFCGQDTSDQKDHLLKHCKNIESKVKTIKGRKSKNAIARCHDIGAAIDSKD